MDKLKEVLTSRKFWGTVAAVITFGLAGEWHEAGLALMAYVGVQGGVDAMSAKGLSDAQATD